MLIDHQSKPSDRLISMIDYEKSNNQTTPTYAVTTWQMSEVCEACSGLTHSATELCDINNWQLRYTWKTRVNDF